MTHFLRVLYLELLALHLTKFVQHETDRLFLYECRLDLHLLTPEILFYMFLNANYACKFFQGCALIAIWYLW